MADLMKHSQTDYKAMAESYGDFYVPAVRIKIAGKQYSSVTAKETKKDSMLLIVRMDAYLCHSEGSSVSVVIEDAYDIEGSRFKETASLGDSMQAEAGYGSVFHEIFYGFVGEIQFEYHGASRQIRITGFDAVALMSQNISAEYYNEKKHSDIVNSIIGNYSGILSAGNIDASGEKKSPTISALGMNDYLFIKNVLCPLAEKEFFIFDGKAYFQSIKKREQSPSVSLKLGQNLFDFQLTCTYANLEIRTVSALGSDPSSVIEGVTQSGKSDSTQKSAVSAVQKQYIPFWCAGDSKSAESAASYWLQEQIMQRQTAEGTCLGMPELVPGRCIKISGIQKKFENKKFWVDSVYHKVDNTGFTSKFTVKGWT